MNVRAESTAPVQGDEMESLNTCVPLKTKGRDYTSGQSNEV
jgi:hypothetical protein